MRNTAIKILGGSIGCVLLLLSICLPAYSDESTDVIEVNIPAGEEVQGKPIEKGFHGLIGLGVGVWERAVGHRHVTVSPLVLGSIRYSDWAYWHLDRGGVWLLQSPDRSLKLGVGLGLRFGWRSDDDDSLLRGMDDRDMSLDGTMNAEWRNRIANIRIRYFHDILGVSDGDGVDVNISHMFLITQKFSLTPFIGMEWQSNRLVNYYYGVRPEEVIPNRPEYRGRDTINLRTGFWAAYRLSPSWSLMGGANVRRLGDGIYDSPIVLDRYRFSTFLGAAWNF